MKLKVCKSDPAVGAVIVASVVKKNLNVGIDWGNETSLDLGDDIVLSTSASIIRFFARSAAQLNLYSQGALNRTEVDHWLSFTIGPLSCDTEFEDALNYLASVMEPKTYLVNKKVSAADYALFGSLYSNPNWRKLLDEKRAKGNVFDWFNFIGSLPEVKEVISGLPKDLTFRKAIVPSYSSEGKPRGGGPENNKKTKGKFSDQPKQTKDEGKFVELPGAEKGKVIVRFPPEASGYLHIGHAKAVLLNQHYRDTFEGKLILRFDDTNPAKEKEEYEQVILDDLKLLGVKYDLFSRSSDHFDTMLHYCEKLIKDGKAFVDNSDAETMKNERDAREDSKCRNNSVKTNLEMWNEMKKASEKGMKCAVRAKIDMKSNNGCMRDPTIYRCKPEPHPATGDKYKVYPTYDFTCPIVDSIEGVTHALRTTEYMDRDEQYFWFIDALGLRKPHIYAYARLSMTNTVMSKRKLTWFVESGSVEGWDDPRFPTVRGVFRRGLTVEALKQFILAQGSSRSVVFMEWDKIWAMNKKVIDPVAPRFTTIEKAYHVPVVISGIKEESVKVDKHPKDSSIGQKTQWKGPKVLIDGADAELLKENENATFINWGNMTIKKVMREQGKVVRVEASPDLENKDFKKTLKLTWLAETEKAPFTPTKCVYYDHIITKAVLDKDDDFKDFIGKDTRTEIEVLGDPELQYLKKGDIIQIQRKGYFIVDVAYKAASPNSCKHIPVRLISIPDGTLDSYGPPGKSKVEPVAKVQPSTKGKKANDSSPKGAVGEANSASAERLNAEIVSAGDQVRKLKAEKADKLEIDAAVKTLLGLKGQFKEATGKDWKPGMALSKEETPKISGVTSNIEELNNNISKQGDLVRTLKKDKAPKDDVDKAVKTLLELKANFKDVSGKDWKPGMDIPKAEPPTSSGEAGGDVRSDAINDKIVAQGNKIRDLKTAKADKKTIETEVKELLALKAQYKESTGKEWKPDQHKSSQPDNSIGGGNNNVESLNADITKQGDLVRKLKSEKADKGEVDKAVKLLLELKAKFKEASGKDWKPGMTVASPKSQETPGNDLENELNSRINLQGDLVRKLKSEKADKADIDANIKILLDLKAKFKEKIGKDWNPKQTPSSSGGANDKKKDPSSGSGKKNKKEQQKKPEQPQKKEASGGQKVTRLGMEAQKEENLADWYSQIIVKAELLEYYDVSGCYILRPWSFAIWESIQSYFDTEIKKLGVTNCYFPMFVSQAALQKEKDHIADFAPEVAWVTRSGTTDLAEPIAVRPTSETVMYPAFAKWIQSYRDLPLKLNQWCNVVRWEFKHPQPFLRTREFLWQEGHTAYAQKAEAEKEVMDILNLYASVYEDLLAIPVQKGRKTEKEKFAGGDYTTTVEAYISAAGRSIQGATSHHLGQNFSKMFEVIYEHPESGEKEYVYQNSWGITTRTIGVLIMVHGDNQGLVLPPRVAMIQVVIVPCGITASLKDEDRKELYKVCEEYESLLKSKGVRARGDFRDNYSPGWKFNHWELKGVPIRLELGPRDIKNGEFVAVRRDNGEKLKFKKTDLEKEIPDLLETIQSSMFSKAKKEMDTRRKIVTKWSDFTKALEGGNTILAPFCGVTPCEDEIKELSKADADADPGAPSMGAKTLCIPFDQPGEIKKGMKCVNENCSSPPKFYTLFGRSY